MIGEPPTGSARSIPEIAAAIAADALSVQYQPIVDLQDYRVVGVEALARWLVPGEGWRGPDGWIPLVEDSSLSRWLLRRVLADAAALRDDGRDDLFVAVNLAPAQIAEAGFLPALAEALRTHGLAPGVLEFELTERHLRVTQDAMRDHLHALRALGCRVSLDDFGTGDSSLQSLFHLPIDQIKVDRTFVRGLPGDATSAAIVDSTVMMAHRMGLTVVAEGVERPEQMDFLRQTGCDFGQGFLFSPALPPAELRSLLEGWPERRAHLERGSVEWSRPAGPSAAPGGPPLHGLRVIAVDDEPLVLEIVERVLVDAGATAIVTSSPAQAIALVQQSPPDVLLSDVHMPGLNGWDLMQLVRHEAPGVVVIAVTGYAEERMRTVRRPDAVVQKPYRAEQLVQTVRAAVAARRRV